MNEGPTREGSLGGPVGQDHGTRGPELSSARFHYASLPCHLSLIQVCKLNQFLQPHECSVLVREKVLQSEMNSNGPLGQVMDGGKKRKLVGGDRE